MKAYPFLKHFAMINLLIFALLLSCTKEEIFVPEKQNPILKKAYNFDLSSSNQNEYKGPIPEATIELKDYSKVKPLQLNRNVVTCADPLTPTSLVAELEDGTSVVESKVGCISGIPQKANIMFAMDVSGSMDGVLNNMKANSTNVLNFLSASIPDITFGVASHSDYPNTYSDFCGYSNEYAPIGNYPYKLDQALTHDFNSVNTAIDDLDIVFHGDAPESYTRLLYEMYADNNIGFEDDAAKIVIAMLDDIPHDCDLGTGGSPGRDGIQGNADDLDFDQVIQEMKDREIQLIVLSNGSDLVTEFWRTQTDFLGGQTFQVNNDGSIPNNDEGLSLEELLLELIAASFTTIEQVTLETTPGFESWLTTVSPASYNDADITVENEFNFDITITVPEGTPAGLYIFEVLLIGDDIQYGSQLVQIDVKNDTDDDDIFDDEDNCPEVSNPDQLDIDGDGIGFACDTEVDLCAVTNHIISLLESIGKSPSSMERKLRMICDRCLNHPNLTYRPLMTSLGYNFNSLAPSPIKDEILLYYYSMKEAIELGNILCTDTPN